MNTTVSFVLQSLKSAFSLWVRLLFIMIPISLSVKVANDLGLIDWLGSLLQPIMTFVGLPGVIGLVWAITLVTNLWAGALLFVTLSVMTPLTTGQVTVLGIMMLMAHGLPLELRMVQKCGVGLVFSLVLRVASAILLGYLFNQTFQIFHILQGPADVVLAGTVEADSDWLPWAIGQARSYVFVLVMLAILVALLDGLKRFGLIYRLGQALAGYLSLIGVSARCAPITLVGMTLGLVYGGALLLREVDAGEVESNEVVLSVVSMNLFHSIIEDTIIVMLMGGALFWILVMRMIYTVVVMKLIALGIRKHKEPVFKLMRI